MEGNRHRLLPAETLARSWQGTPVLCVAGRGSLDEASAAMLAQLVQKQGIGARVVPSTAVSPPNLFALDATDVQMAYLCYLEPGAFTNPHYLVRRLRRKMPKATIAGGFWTLKADEADERSALTKTGADLVATLLHQAVAQVTAAAREAGYPHLATGLQQSALDPVAAVAPESGRPQRRVRMVWVSRSFIASRRAIFSCAVSGWLTEELPMRNPRQTAISRNLSGNFH